MAFETRVLNAIFFVLILAPKAYSLGGSFDEIALCPYFKVCYNVSGFTSRNCGVKLSFQRFA